MEVVMVVWSERADLERLLRVMTESGDPVAGVRLSAMLVEDGRHSEAADLRHQVAEICPDDVYIMLLLAEALRDAELVDREPAIRRHLGNPEYKAELDRHMSGREPTPIPEGDVTVLGTRRSPAPPRQPNSRWPYNKHADAVIEYHYRKEAERGSVQAMHGLADLFEYYGDLLEAQSWLRRAQRAGDQEAAGRLDAIAARQDRLAEMERWYLLAAERGATGAMVAIGRLREHGGDQTDAELWFRRAAEAGSVMAEHMLLGLLWRQGRGDEMASWYRHRAENGDLRAIYRLANEEEQQGNLEQAEQWLRQVLAAGKDGTIDPLWMLLRRQGREDEIEPECRQAAARGNTAAMRILADMSQRRGEPAEAERWLGAATAAGDSSAAHSLHELLEKSDRITELRQWLFPAARAGNVWATYLLADQVTQFGSDAETERWYRETAESGRTDAMGALARMLDHAGDREQARSWLRRAAEGGDVDAVIALAKILERDGEDPDAERWIQWAAEIERTHGFEPHSGGSWVAPIAVIAVAVIPFVNALLARVANDSYDEARSLLRRLVSRKGRDEGVTSPLAGQLLVVEDPDPQLDLAIHLWSDTSDEAIRALKDLDLDKIAGNAAGEGKIRIHWNHATQSWQVLDEGKQPPRKRKRR